MIWLSRLLISLYVLVLAAVLLVALGYIYQLHFGLPSQVVRLVSPLVLEKQKVTMDAEFFQYTPGKGLRIDEMVLFRPDCETPFFEGDLRARLNMVSNRFEVYSIQIDDAKAMFRCADWEEGACAHPPIVVENLQAVMSIDESTDVLDIQRLRGNLAGIDVGIRGGVSLHGVQQSGKTKKDAKLDPVFRSLMPLLEALESASYESPPRLMVDLDLESTLPEERHVEMHLKTESPGWIAGQGFDRLDMRVHANRLGISVKEVAWRHDDFSLDFSGEIEPGSQTLTDGELRFVCEDETSGFYTPEPILLDDLSLEGPLRVADLFTGKLKTQLAGIDVSITGSVRPPNQNGGIPGKRPQREEVIATLEPLMATVMPVWKALVKARHEAPPTLVLDVAVDMIDPSKNRVDTRVDATAPGWISGLHYDSLSMASSITPERIEDTRIEWRKDDHYAIFTGNMVPSNKVVSGQLDIDVPAPLLQHFLPEAFVQQILAEDLYIPGDISGILRLGPAPIEALGKQWQGHLKAEAVRFKGLWLHDVSTDASLFGPELKARNLRCRVGEGEGSGPGQFDLDMNLSSRRFSTHVRLQSDPVNLIPLAPANEDLYRSFDFVEPPTVDVRLGGVAGLKASGWVNGRVHAVNAVYRGVLLDEVSVDIDHSNRVTRLTNLFVRRPEGGASGQMVINNPAKSLEMDLISTMDFRALSQLAGRQTAETVRSIFFRGTPEIRVRGLVDMRSEGGGEHRLAGSIRAGEGGFDWLTIQRPSFTWTYADKRFDIANLKGGLFDGNINGALSITSLHRKDVPPMITVDLGMEDGRLEQLDLPGIDLSNMALVGPFGANIRVRGPLGPWDFNKAMTVEGSVMARESSIRGVPLRSFSSGLAFANGVTSFSQFEAVRDEGRATGSLTFDTPRKQLRVKVDSTADLQAVAKVAGPAVVKALSALEVNGPNRLRLTGIVDQTPARAHALKGELSFQNGGIAWVKFDECTLQWRLNDSVLSLMDIQGRLYGGPCTGVASITNLNRAGSPQLALRMSVNDAELGRFDIPGRNLKRLKLTGLVKSELHLSGPIGTGPFQDTMLGGGTVKIREGELFRIPLLGGLSDILSKIIPGFGFSTQSDFDAKFAIADKQAKLTDLKLLGDVLSAKGDVTYHFDKRLDGKVKIELFKKGLLTEIVRLITSPISFFLDVRLKGTIDKPEWYLNKIPKELRGIF